VRTTILVLTVLAACPKRTVHLPASNTTVFPELGAPVIPTDPSIQAVAVPNGPLSSLVLTCTDVVGPAGNVCAVEAEAPALVVGMAELAEGPVSIPMSQGAIAWDRSDPGCENVVTTAEGGEPRAWEPGRAIRSLPPGAAAAHVEPGVEVTSVLALDLEGDGVEEWLVDGVSASGAFSGVLRDGQWVVLFEEVRPELADDATEQERWDAEVQRWTGEIVGVTDVGLDGQLELVMRGDGFESWGYEVGIVSGGGWEGLGQAGCAH
jgi:hypothetical protein